MQAPLSIAALGLCLVSFAGIAPARASRAARAPTPQAAWETARAAYRRGDFRTYINTVSPQSHDECICHLSKILSGAIGAELLESEEEDGLDDLNEILDKYDVLSLEAPAHRADSLNKAGLWGRAAIARIRNKPGLYKDVMRYLRKHGVGPELPSLLTLNLGDVVVNGSEATGSLSGRPRLRPEAKKITFERRGDAWFVRLPPICLSDMPEVDVPWRP